MDAQDLLENIDLTKIDRCFFKQLWELILNNQIMVFDPKRATIDPVKDYSFNGDCIQFNLHLANPTEPIKK